MRAWLELIVHFDMDLTSLLLGLARGLGLITIGISSSGGGSGSVHACDHILLYLGAVNVREEHQVRATDEALQLELLLYRLRERLFVPASVDRGVDCDSE